MSVQSAISNAELQSIVSAASNTNKLVVVDFTASWCGPCKKIKPFVHALAKKYSSKTVFVEVDVDRAKNLAQQYEVRGMPTFIFFLKGKKVEEFSGAQFEILSSTVERLVKQCNPFESSTGFTLGGSSTPTALMPTSTSNTTFASQRINPWADPKFVPPYTREKLSKKESTALSVRRSTSTSTMNKANDEDEDLAKAIAISLAASENIKSEKANCGQQLNDPALTKNLDQSLVKELIDMGFSRIRSEKALILSATKNLESATNWLSTHETDTDIDEPLFMVNIDSKDAKLVRGAPLGHKPGFIYEDDLDDTMGKIKQRAASEKVIAKKEVGVIDKPLTDMTKNEKIEHIKKLKAARKVQQSISDKMAKKEREEQRRRSVKEAAAAKKVCEDLAQKRAADARRREKKEDKMRRQRIKDKIAKDKQARLAAISTTMPKNSSDE